MFLKRLKITLILPLLFFLNNSFAEAAKSSWQQWVKELRSEAITKGIRPELFDEVFARVKEPNLSVLSLDRNQPEHRISFLQYRSSRADAYRIKLGRQQYQHYQSLLTEIGDKYGVSPCFIVSLWGLETSYGFYLGKFPVIQALATLAYGPRRAEFFRMQLLYALQILNEGHIDYDHFKGEWAGASGQPQFLPSSWHEYAVDYDGDGKKNIWTSYPDAFASIANYLVQNGWRANQPWAIPVSINAEARQYLNDKTVTKPLSTWIKLGVRAQGNQPWPEDTTLPARLIEPDGGPDFLIFNNFDVIMKWNHSNYYVGTVGYLAEQICGKPLY